MAIVPSHFIWQRERAEHHSGAQRLYRNRGEILIPRGPSASPEPCSLCAKTTAHPLPRPSSAGARSASVPLETTPHKCQASCRPSKLIKARHTCSITNISGECVHCHLAVQRCMACTSVQFVSSNIVHVSLTFLLCIFR